MWLGIDLPDGGGVGELWNDLAALHLDRAQRCVVPFQLTDLPAGAKVLGCTVSFPPLGQRYASAQLVVGDGKGSQANVELGATTILGPAVPDRTVNGHAVQWIATKDLRASCRTTSSTVCRSCRRSRVATGRRRRRRSWPA
ncbi:hypothetical protein GCM10023322_06790 [Rugosimonospora acidiphila]|uniref:Uncharacterized protein n=1 Tax=Rugosimonospora acidiphila TaxID=556531 RepID=A0ABP9RJB0_9ACTN